MLEKAKVDCLLVGQTPPPYHGQAVVTGMLFEHVWTRVRVSLLRMSYSDSIQSVGRFSLSKITHLFYLIFMTWKEAFLRSPEILYYLPASANRTPVLRDIVYLAATKWCFRKVVFHFHAGGLPQFLEGRSLLGKIAGAVYSEPDVAIDVIQTTPPNGRYFGAKQNVVVKNGVKVGRAERQRSENSVLRLLYVGILNEGKGVLDIVQTMSLLRKRGVTCEVFLVGGWISREFEREVKSLVDSLEVEGMVHFSGSLDGDAKWQMYADADCMFFPSHYEAETFGMVLVEAMAFALPLVTTRWRGIPLVVGDSECAILCDVHAPRQYAEAIELLAHDVEKRKEMGVSARRYYEKEYTKEIFLGRMEEVFENLAKEK